MKSSYWRSKLTIVIIQFLLLFLFWLVLSGHYDIKHIVIGIICSGLVTYLTHDFLLHRSSSGKELEITPKRVILSGIKIILYLPWLIAAIIKANIDVAVIILNPKMPVNPVFMQFRTEYKWNIARVTLANSITLTPGTITVDMKSNRYLVHAITPGAASVLESAIMQNRVGQIFEEKIEQPPHIHWSHSVEELEK